MRLHRLKAQPENISDEKEQALERMVLEYAEENRLACARAELISLSLGVERFTVGAAADRLNIKISSCQMGCF